MTLTVDGTPYLYDSAIEPGIDAVASRVRDLRSAGRLSADALRHIRRAFRIKNIYHSNAIEGNLLTIGETRQVVELGLTLGLTRNGRNCWRIPVSTHGLLA